jgi:hypothetical protein
VLALLLAVAVVSGCIFNPDTEAAGEQRSRRPDDSGRADSAAVEGVSGLATSICSRACFPNTADQAPYFFFLNAPVNGIDNWDLTEELRIHRRMFKPEDPLPGESPGAAELWLVVDHDQSVATGGILGRAHRSLQDAGESRAAWTPNKWKATEAEFHADILFETQVRPITASTAGTTSSSSRT